MMSKSSLFLWTATLLLSASFDCTKAGLLGDLLDGLCGALYTVGDTLGEIVGGVVGGVVGLLEGLLDGVATGVTDVLGFLEKVLGGVLSTVGGIEGFLMEIFDGDKDLVYDVMDYTGVPYDDLTPREVLQSILGVFDCKTFYELPKPIRKRIVIVVIRVLVKRKQK